MFYRKELNRPLTSDEVDSNFKELEEKANASFVANINPEIFVDKAWIEENFLPKADAGSNTLINVVGLNDEFYYTKAEVDAKIKKLINKLKEHNITIDLEEE